MDRKKGNAGFTLMELLAVIVVLAIVSVIGTATVLPLLSNIRENGFVTEVNELKSAGSKAISLIMLEDENAKAAAKAVTGGYCFTVEDLIDLGVFEKPKDSHYAGTVIATKAEGANVYSYKVSLYNGDTNNPFYGYEDNGTFAKGEIINNEDEAISAGYTATCPTS